MASVFTYDPDPPRVSSPWSTPPVLTPHLVPVDAVYRLGGLIAPQPALLSDCGIGKLEAEPQEGPTEYKLHLLLRPRRSFSSSSTGPYVSGSYQSRSRLYRSEPAVVSRSDNSSPVPAPTIQSRQNRLQHLTTQLLWRLQQSSPYHSSSTAGLVLPVLPETVSKPGSPLGTGQLLPGLEGSRGALYEIGVSDDGKFVGLTRDEMDESLVNLQAMAASLGCKVQIIRTVIVGECKWTEATQAGCDTQKEIHTEELWVAEALVAPNAHLPQHAQIPTLISRNGQSSLLSAVDNSAISVGESGSQVEQLRISLTGATTSGKSSLLGTLSTSTLDNGRGKSRLSLLKHRHEIATGVTSSVAPELIGYQTVSLDNATPKQRVNIINYGCGNVSSWNDIHNAAEAGRLVLLTDSAGHPRYRRTTIRGLVSWSPHWTLCCVAADEGEDRSGRFGATTLARDVLGPANAGIGLYRPHLELCLKLDLSLVMIITKFDLASKGSLRQTLAKVLSTIKAAGRHPVMLKPSGYTDIDPHLESLNSTDEEEVKAMLASASEHEFKLVPIVITSAVTGSGIDKLHALLRNLPIPQMNVQPNPALGALDVKGRVPRTLFHIDEVYSKSDQLGNPKSSEDRFLSDAVQILSGHLRYGVLSVGDEVRIGPFMEESGTDDSKSPYAGQARSYPINGSKSPLIVTQAQHRCRPSSGDFINSKGITTDRSISCRKEWQRVHIVSIRNLRLPTRRLLADQVGTIGIKYLDTPCSAISKTRKGMILAQPICETMSSFHPACSGFRAYFDDKDYSVMEPGALYTIYTASIRASARLSCVETVDETPFHDLAVSDGVGDGMFGFEDNSSDEGGVRSLEDQNERKLIEVTFQLAASREWIEIGTRVLVMPGSGVEGSAGLEGYVGRITQALV